MDNNNNTQFHFHRVQSCRKEINKKSGLINFLNNFNSLFLGLVFNCK